MSSNHFLVNLKAYVALVGSIATALLGVFTADATVGKVLTVVAICATAFGTWYVENADAVTSPGSDVAPTDLG